MHHPQSGMINSGPTLLQFSFPRTGGHFLTHCIRALYDTEPENSDPIGGVAWHDQPSGAVQGIHLRGQAEIADRERELNPITLYALTLRANDGRRSPLNFVHGRTGVHGIPGGLLPGEKAVVLIRDPLATVYSLYRVWRDRWEPDIPFDAGSVYYHLCEYCRYYDAAIVFKHDNPHNVNIMRFRDLAAGPESLRDLCNFLDHTPKLEPEFVWHMTKFENITTPKARTFYRQGNNEAWRSDPDFFSMLTQVGEFDFTPYGYPPLAESLQNLALAAGGSI